MKITEEEIQKIQELTSKTEKQAVELGAIKLQKIALKNRKNAVEKGVAELNAERLKLFRELEDKYGSGQLNVDTWEINS